MHFAPVESSEIEKNPRPINCFGKLTRREKRHALELRRGDAVEIEAEEGVGVGIEANLGVGGKGRIGRA